jgi:hypothetical protein
MATQPKILIPTCDREEKERRAREEEAAQQRMVENGRSILTFWIIGYIIQLHRRDFHLAIDCFKIIPLFAEFTNLAESGIQFDDSDYQFLGDFEQEFKREYLTNNFVFEHEVNCRDRWKKFFLENFWISNGFIRFEEKFAALIVLPSSKKTDGAMLTISDNLWRLDKLTMFLKHLSMQPNLMQLMSSFYASSGLTDRERKDLVFLEKKDTNLKHQIKVRDSKLKDCEMKLKECEQRNKNLQEMLDRDQDQTRRMIEKIETMQHEIEALNLAIQRARNVKIASCPVCMMPDNGRCGMKITPCCGQPLCESCFETMKITQGRQNPPCPNCRCSIQIGLVPITDSHPIYLRVEPRKMVSISTMVQSADFIDADFGGPAIEPIPNPPQEQSESAKKLSDFWSQIMLSKNGKPCAGGGGAAMSK